MLIKRRKICFKTIKTQQASLLAKVQFHANFGVYLSVFFFSLHMFSLLHGKVAEFAFTLFVGKIC